MRAAWYEQQGAARAVLIVGEREIPTPKPGEVRVRVYNSGINVGDVKKRANTFNFGMSYPQVIPHSDGAGVIDAVGEGVDTTRIGQRVWVYGAQSYRPFGTAAEYVAVASTHAILLPQSTSFAVGACLGISARTACAAVFAGGSVSEKVVLVTGASGNVGYAAVTLAAWGGALVIATIGDMAQADRVHAAGAKHVLHYRADNLESSILAITRGVGVQHIVEVAFGMNIALNSAILAPHGTIATYSSDAAAEPTLPFWPLLFNNATIRLIGSDDLLPKEEQHALTTITACLKSDILRPHIAQRFPLEDIALAHEVLEHPRSAGGHVILDIS